MLWYRLMLLACFLVGAISGFAYYVNNYRVWQNLAAEAETYARTQR